MKGCINNGIVVIRKKEPDKMDKTEEDKEIFLIVRRLLLLDNTFKTLQSRVRTITLRSSRFYKLVFTINIKQLKQGCEVDIK